MSFKTPNSKKQVFKISYDMPETADHTIDAELLGTAILSMTRALRHSDKILNGESSNIQVDVRANAEGSFVVEFVTWLNAGGANVLSTIGLAGLGAAGITGTVFGVLNEIKDKKIVARVKKDGSTVDLELDDGSVIECDQDVASIVTDPHVRKELDNIIKSPIAGKEQAKFIVKDELDTAITEINSEEAFYFKSIPSKTLEEVEAVTKQVTIHFSQVNFDGAAGWKAKLPNGNVVSVRMRDEAFRDRVNNGYEEFSKTKPCIVKLTTVERTKADGSATVNYYIDEVIRQV
ncbi:hypothetical protein [Vibrio cholerae]|uniref:hypothetical protein n=1 Tax=Vibrio cholerae TaxID=666 RepID=UPI002D1EC6C5|nr:hypothetical protein [Vibrio cholerae]EGQ9324704.1 hypothetical protein [Vibrio cholerae]EGR4501948.1 hypothetical protein [Vibrio cholerae]MEB3761760.1 hypothetical protein [Vibrio cholerae]